MYAQNAAAISGSVQDAKHGQVSGAKVTVTRTETGNAHTTLSDGSGFFSFPVLLPGHYDVKVEKDGFGTTTQSGVQIFTGGVTSVNFSLLVGQVEEHIDVQTDEALLQTTSAAITDVIENKTIVNLPLLDRRATQLQRLNGFVIGMGTGSGSSFAIAGGRGGNANYTVDGGTTQNLLQGVPTQMFDLPIDALQEFTLSVSDYTADQGRSSGGVIQMSTKTGSNNFHGSAYLYYRSDSLQAKPLFATANPPLSYKLFGGSIGGPIRRDKTFFFFTYEGRLQTSTTVLNLLVPTAAQRSGDFSALAVPIIDPNTGVQAQYNGVLNVLPPSELDPYGKQLVSYYPQPNIPGVAANTNNFTYNDQAKSVINDYVVRLDHTFSTKDSIYFRFLAQPDHTDTANVYPTAGTDNYGVLSHNFYYNPSATWNHIFTGSLVNEARFTFTNRQALSINHGVNSAAATQLALPGTNPGFFPGVTVSGFAGIGGTGQQQRLQTPIISNEYTDNVSWQHGNHQFKFGADYRTSADGDLYSPSAGGLFGFTPQGAVAAAQIASAGATPAGSLANLLLGRVNTATRSETEYLYSAAWSWGLYAQDNWHVNNKLTLNYGIRWDIDSPRYLENNRQNSFDTNAINPVSNTPGVITFSGINGVSKYANNFDTHLFGPRFGFAYTPVAHSVVRGGFGILYPGEYDQATPIVLSTGFSNSVTLNSPNSNAGTPAFLLKNNGTAGTGLAAYPTTAQLTAGYGAVAAPYTSPAPYIAPQFISPRRLTGYLYQASLNVQHEFAGNLLLDIGFLGTYGHHLASPFAESINQISPANLATLANGTATLKPQALRPFPQFSNVQNLYPDIGQSRYNGVNVGVQKRFSHGFQYQANYTYSKFIDNEESRSELAGYPGTDTYTDYYNPKNRFGLSGNDVRHRLIANGVLELPFGRGKLVHLNNAVANQVVGGWSISGLTEIHSGTALSPIDLTNNTNSFSDGVRPNLTGNPNDLSSNRSRTAKIAQWFDTAAFSQNAAYTFGNAPRTFGRGPRLVNTDLTLLKRVNFYEQHAIEFRLEALNAFNHANLGNPNTQFGSPNFGKITALSGATTGSRTLQLAAHYTF
ncbi:TonB-dependent receptor [Granulicella rosea]|nr:carboxypeptidase regulatory-like domain-containing protein [Granulicella rosea]